VFSDKNPNQYERHTEVTQNRRPFIPISRYHPFLVREITFLFSQSYRWT